METHLLWGLLWLLAALGISIGVCKYFFGRYVARLEQSLDKGLVKLRGENNLAMARLLQRMGLVLEKLGMTLNTLSDTMREISETKDKRP